jgi:Domain of unknown function (DUF5597)/Beta-galactosidase
MGVRCARGHDRHRFSFWVAGLVALACGAARCENVDDSLPHLVQQNGRSALFVDGAPYLILGAQVNNSSAWPAMMPKVWPAMEALHVNTVEMPVYWEQFEPEQRRFDFKVVDTLLAQAREHRLHLVLLWFATWKNGSNHYMPQWMKLGHDRFPNIVGEDGKEVDSPSPFSEATLQADSAAFAAFMRHLREVDAEHTVLMVQVENEPGAWGSVRDYSATAQRAFERPVPAEALAAMQKPTDKPGANWQESFGEDADEFFQVWYVARFIGQVALAGKAEYPLPLYVNASLRDPLNPGHPPKYEIGGPNDNVFPLWKAAAPAVDILAPDIYLRELPKYLKVLDLYHRTDNPLFVPETIGQGPMTRFFYAALGRGAIGYSPFGLDYTLSAPTGSATSAPDGFTETALNYEVFGPMSREIARLNFAGKLQTAVEGEPEPDPAQLATAPVSQGASGPPARVLYFNGWGATIAFGTFARGGPRPQPQPAEPDGRVLIAQLAPNQFLVTGLHARVAFFPTGQAEGRPSQYLSVEEGHYENGQFKAARILNGDQTDWGLIFASTPSALRVSLYTR